MIVYLFSFNIIFDAMEENNINLCRLCFDEGNINIFDENGQMLEISTIIRQHLDDEMFENDVLPKYVCSVCWNQVRSFHSFHEFVKSAQNTYLSKLLKSEITTSEITDTFVDVQQLSSNMTPELSASVTFDAGNLFTDCTHDNQNLLIEDIVMVKGEPAHDGSGNAIPESKLSVKSRTNVRRKKVGRPRKITNHDLSNTIGFKHANAVNQHQTCLNILSESPEIVIRRKVGRPKKDKKKIDSECEPDQKESTEFEFEPPNRGGVISMEKTDDSKENRVRPKKRKCDDKVQEWFKSKVQTKISRGEQSKQLSTYTLSEDYESFMLQNFNMSCDLCLANDFKTLFDVKTHYMDEHQFNNGYIKCCNKKFIYISQVKDHIDYHLDPDVLKCKLCSKQEKSKALLRKHMREAHEERNRFKCDICGHTTNREPHIKMHILRVHVPKNPDFKCDQCDREFSSIEVLNSHTFVVHERQYGKRHVQCEICGKSINIFHLERHRVIHLDKEDRLKKRAKCDICFEWFSSVGSLKVHKTLHNEVTEECTECHKIFGSKAKLNKHIRRMHREREYKCTLCPSTFDSKAGLKKHTESHTRVKQYPCLFCPKIFHVEKSMHIHYSRHHRAEFDEVKRQRRIERVGEP